MVILYNISIALYQFGIFTASFFNEKARLWIEGRKNLFHKIQLEIGENKSSNISALDPRKKIWIHVASLGEFEQGRPLIEALKNKTSDYTIILTFFSPSGYEIRKNYSLAEHIFYLPLDTADNAERFIDIVKPDMAVFVKYEFWYHFLNELKKRQIPTLLISGILTEKQFKASNPYSFLLKKMLGCFTHLFMQNTPSVQLLKHHGFENVTLVGDTRIDRVLSIANESKTFRIVETFVKNAPILIGGSTWQPDEAIILELIKNPAFNHFKFIFAPHDISKNNVERLVKMLPEKSLKYSECIEGTDNLLTETDDIENTQLNTSRILVIDNIGMLSSIYKYGTIAYIGGGFGKGIHNTLEAIAFGLPVIFGTKYKKFEEAVRLVDSGGGFTVSSYLEFEKIMLQLTDPEQYKKASEAAQAYVNNNKGASDLIFKYICGYRF